MTGEVWISSWMRNSQIGNKLGLSEKYYGEDWGPATYEYPPFSDVLKKARDRHYKGQALERTDFPEALYVFNEKHFKRVGDLFAAGPFYAVKGRLAEVLSQFDLGGGGLIPLPIYQADKVTPVEGEFFLLNFGARKQSFLPEKSRRVEPLLTMELDGKEVWSAKFGLKDGEIAVSSAALEGADLWMEPTLWKEVFLSGRLVEAIRAAKVTTDLWLARCRIVAENGELA